MEGELRTGDGVSGEAGRRPKAKDIQVVTSSSTVLVDEHAAFSLSQQNRPEHGTPLSRTP